MQSDKAYALLEIKSVDGPRRIIEGWASTPKPDRGGDIMVPEGAQFQLPMPLLWQHQDPIGEVFEATVVPGQGHPHQGARLDRPYPRPAEGLRRRRRGPRSRRPPPLVRGLSIGWRPLESAPVAGTKFTKFLKWLWVELSGVVHSDERRVLDHRHQILRYRRTRRARLPSALDPPSRRHGLSAQGRRHG